MDQLVDATVMDRLGSIFETIRALGIFFTHTNPFSTKHAREVLVVPWKGNLSRTKAVTIDDMALAKGRHLELSSNTAGNTVR